MRTGFGSGQRTQELLDIASAGSPSSHSFQPRLRLASETDSAGGSSWLWRVIAACLGIRLAPGEKPIVATVFYVVGLLSGIGEPRL